MHAIKGVMHTLADFGRNRNVEVLHEYANCIERNLMWPRAHRPRHLAKLQAVANSRHHDRNFVLISNNKYSEEKKYPQLSHFLILNWI